MEPTDRKDRIINLYLSLLFPMGVAALAWAVWRFPVERVNAPLIVLSIVTIFFGSYLRIQLPRTKIHLTVSDALIFLSLLMYGAEIAVLLAVLEAAFTSINFRRQGVAIKPKTVAINILIAAVSGGVTAFAVGTVFGSSEIIIGGFGTTSFFWALTVMALSQFLANSILVAAFVAIKSESTIWRVWNEYCLNALVMYVSGAAMAGTSAWALTQINFALFAAVAGFFALVYMTYRRYVDDVKTTAAQAEKAEHNRADDAEQHIVELKHYVEELEKSSKALRWSREKFRQAAYHDALTGLPNRNFFIDAIETLLDRGRAGQEVDFAVLFLDLNRFRTINDSLGHSTGDRVIRHTAKRLSEMTNEGDIVGHFGGDEFAFILNEINTPEKAEAFAEKIANCIAEPFRFKSRNVYTSVSIGIAFGGIDTIKAEDILRDADMAMYYAKDNDKSCAIFDKTMHTKAVSQQQMETDLRYAIVCNELELFYQPIIDLNKLMLSGFEALVRWNHPERGLIAPSEFIPLSEETGLVIPMTLEILRSACGQIVDWQGRIPDSKAIDVSVNLSGKHFTQPHLVQQIKTILDETKMNPACLKLEITESVVMENAENAISMLRQIRDIGVRLSVDDFGTGYSSLSYLHRFPIDTLKVDRSFVNMMEDDGENAEIVHTIIAMAQTLKLNVIAEGIENLYQLNQLRILGCEYGQGYLFSRPVQVAEIEKILVDRYRWMNILTPNLPAAAESGEYLELWG